ncbi:MAG: hypothetical protein IPK97_04595 [Ahniella sp.]|nr:hypothetical protein [Ahniella sp.]
MNSAFSRLAALVGLLLVTTHAAAARPHESMTLNFEEIKVEHHAGASLSSPFAIDIVVDAQAQPKVVFRPLRVYNVTLKRGIVASDQSPSFTELTFALNDPQLGESAWGELTIVMPHGDPVGASAQALSKFGTGTLVLNVTNTYVRDHIELTFQPRAGATLFGQPAHWFNRPGSGEDLVARVPIPAAGGSMTSTLQVSAGRQSFTVPISIKRAAAVGTN